ncbi:hypothetical protein BegalDRAFT_2444 [Beggiatoa alba B18LD]|uniref:Uncharacterized protein n=1 Tax=Beggiatoa alba B18LD TaxID=395493 RepID=I3CI52_9GAMM|nr:hypothetical protein [Beggiatoa alba]EIJ43295.1 hypothetical protein BegalDRAFT_2444 [Beggiatoa alba B18LD]
MPLTVQLPRLLVLKLFEYVQYQPNQIVEGIISQAPDNSLHCYPPLPCFTPRNTMESAQMLVQQMQPNHQLFAFYHASPQDTLTPDAIYKTPLACYPKALFLIISLNIKGVLELRGFHQHDNHLQELTLEVPAE